MRWHRTNKLHHYTELEALFAVSSATGEFAYSSSILTSIATSTPATQTSNSVLESRESTVAVSQRVRTRGVPLPLDSSGPERKRTKTNSSTDEATELIIAVLKDQQGGGRVRLNTIELAIQLLQQEYEALLLEEDFLIAIDFLTVEAKASVFITLTGKIRDTWLFNNIGITTS